MINYLDRDLLSVNRLYSDLIFRSCLFTLLSILAISMRGLVLLYVSSFISFLSCKPFSYSFYVLHFSIKMFSSLLILNYSKTHLLAIKSLAHSMEHADLRKTGLFSASASIHVLRYTDQCAAVMEGLISASVFFKVMLVF